ncbi:hypothetical protein E4P39_03585 [Blastococcus sp. CT_GayMR19]|uniref:hypothetical protein n=1 Tax=Blastococcus sp. CT_GayMR19 TaxID=2559608 RepID=UPI0010738384|nr:hypothetical protein [Blastococcus sp. CT_GayMR19]TFV78315.1 hypothetical protein E4P39_03585 [Blastococcus sp. CT_GayMR19]
MGITLGPDDGVLPVDHASSQFAATEETAMTDPTTAARRRTGAAAVAAGFLLAASVAAELVRSVQTSDGSVTDLPAFALILTTWVAGAGALILALLGLGGSRSAAGPLPRAGRIGRGFALTGAGLLAAFGVSGLVSGVLAGAPAEWTFLLFAVGLLLFLVASVPLALGLRRAGGLGGWWVTALVAGAGVLVGLGATADPWHDLGLFVFFAAWVALGLRLLRRRSVPGSAPRSRTGARAV